MLAYEPVWAIGAAGEPADSAYVNEQHTGIRQVLKEMYSPEIAADIPLLYGGSVNSDNFRSYAQVEDVDGLFVGRAAWEIRSFMQLLEMSRQFCDGKTP
jgi:triosephosphate isomerase